MSPTGFEPGRRNGWRYNYKPVKFCAWCPHRRLIRPIRPDIAADDPAWDGVYVNRLLSANSIPGSIFKVVTINAAIENIPDLFQRKWTCTGSVNIGGEEVTCPHAHGEQDIEEALANSCNGVFGQLAVELGGETMQKYADAAGLTKSIKVDGIQSSVGKFDFSGNDNQLACRVSVRVRIPCVRSTCSSIWARSPTAAKLPCRV